MSYAPANLTFPDPVYVGPWSRLGVGPKVRGSLVTQPTAGAVVAANTAYYQPFYLTRPYDMQRMWWQNGTPGTDSIQTAIYTVDGSNVLDCTVSSARTLTAGTTDHLQYVGASVAAHGITSNTSTTDGTSFVTDSVTMKARPGLVYALIFINSKASAAEAATTVVTTGGAQTFVSRVTTTYGASTEGRVSMWTCVPTADVTATITISFTGTQTGCAWTLTALTNVDTTTNHGVVQSVVGTGSSTTPLATLAAFGSANNMTLGANANVADTTTTPGTGFTELYDINYATPTNCLQVQWGQNDTTSDGTITSAQWGAIAAEIKSLGTTRILAPGRYYGALVCTGVTATVFRVVSALTFNLGVYQQASMTTGLPLTPTLAATAGGLINFGITSRATP